jgi:hypothetical protein
MSMYVFAELVAAIREIFILSAFWWMIIAVFVTAISTAQERRIETSLWQFVSLDLKILDRWGDSSTVDCELCPYVSGILFCSSQRAGKKKSASNWREGTQMFLYHGS